ncbi:MAG: cytochrome C oxidase subunit IV family protein [Vicinamibacterales bacterium]
MSGHVSPKSTYYAIFGALMVLTLVTVAVAFINLGSLNFPVAIGIALTKATLVILFFMHVKYSSRLTKMVVGMAFFFLVILLALTMTDYLSRGWFASPRGTAGAGTQVTISPPAPARQGAGETAPSTSPGH